MGVDRFPANLFIADEIVGTIFLKGGEKGIDGSQFYVHYTS
jgi:hypothetical protein